MEFDLKRDWGGHTSGGDAPLAPQTPHSVVRVQPERTRAESSKVGVQAMNPSYLSLKDGIK